MCRPLRVSKSSFFCKRHSWTIRKIGWGIHPEHTGCKMQMRIKNVYVFPAVSHCVKNSSTNYEYFDWTTTKYIGRLFLPRERADLFFDNHNLNEIGKFSKKLAIYAVLYQLKFISNKVKKDSRLCKRDWDLQSLVCCCFTSSVKLSVDYKVRYLTHLSQKIRTEQQQKISPNQFKICQFYLIVDVKK